MTNRFLAILLATIWSTAAAAEDYIKVASWNIENLGSSDSRQSPAALAQHIQLMNPDVIALQEIYDTNHDSGVRSNEVIDRALAIVSELPGQDWAYELTEKKNPSDYKQLVGVAWNQARLSKVGDTYKIDVQDNPGDGFDVWKRHPHAIMLSAGDGKTDIVVVSLHMKSNVGCGDTCDEWRQAEANELVSQLSAISSEFSGEEDIILIGDTNMRGTWEAGHQLIIDAGFHDLNSEDIPTYVGRNSPFDRIFVPQGQYEFRWSRQYILSPGRPGNHENGLSDHHMIAAMVRIMDDDD